MSAATSDADDEHEEPVLAKQIRLKTASKNACWKCDQRNTKYMISCNKCERYYHHTCANVDKEYCKEGDYECSFCLESRDNDSELADKTQISVERRKQRGENNDPEVYENASDEADTGAISEFQEPVIADDVTPEELREELLKARRDVQAGERRRLKEQDQMMKRIRQLEREHTEAARRNAESNERYQKQLREMQNFFSRSRTPQKSKTRRRHVVEMNSSSDEELDDRKVPSTFETRMERMCEEFGSMVNVKKSKNAPLHSFGTAKEKKKTPPKVSSNMANAKNYYSAPKNSNTYYEQSSSSEMESVEPSAFDKLAMTLNRSNIQQLPVFNGDPKMWPLFESVFKSTTKEGNFSSKENVSRLAKALKSPAIDLVMDLLMYSADANGIMEELRLHYGKPERIIVGLMDELMAMKSPRDQPEHKLVDFANKVKYFVTSVKAVRMYSELDNEYALSKLAQKLHPSAFREWTKIRLKNPTANIERFAKYLTERVKLIPPAPTRYEENTNEPRTRTNRPQGRVMAHHEDSASSRADKKCIRCKGAHATPRCYKLEKDSVGKRLDFAYDNKICLSCLSSSDHIMRYCPDKKRCGIQGCIRYHHAMLHDSKDVRVNAHQTSPTSTRSNRRSTFETARNVSDADIKSQDSSSDVRYYNNTHKDVTSKVLYQIAPITLHGNDNTIVNTYVLLDGASSVTLMEEGIFNSLKLTGKRRDLTLQWTNDITRSEDSYLTSVWLTGGKRRKVHKISNVSTVKNLALPHQTVNTKELYEKYSHLRGIPLDDMTNVRPRMLIGLQHAKFLVAKRTCCGDDEEPVAIKTELGWIVFGRSAPSIHIVSLHCDASERNFQFHMTEPDKYDKELHQLVKEYFTTESFGVAVKSEIMTDEDRRAQKIIDETMRFEGNRAEIGLLWNSNDVQLPDSYPMAKRRLICQEKMLFKKPELLAWTNNHIKEMLDKEYIRLATEKDLSAKWDRVAYIPIFTVVNENKIPPKPRLVMDFAARAGSEGTSVNSKLLKGPDNLASLLAGLCKFRENKVAVSADVKEMFHQVVINATDQQCQRFLWRDGNTSAEPKIYIMQRMAFGPTCSPACAQAVKNTNADKFINECPEAVQGIKKTTYVDDYLNSHATVAEAFRVSTDAIKIFDNISFSLVGFQSNKSEFLDMLPSEIINPNLVNLDPDEAYSMIAKILGMRWKPADDVFIYKLNVNLIDGMLDADHHPTKREVLRLLMKIFDPLGLISHYLIRAKTLLQEIWRDGTDWDEKINPRLLEQWRNWCGELKNVEKLEIQRQYAPVDPASSDVTLIVFVDASEIGFAATAYFRFKYKEDVHLAHVMSKTKVAPLKQLSIPKLELQAAVLGVRLAQSVKSLHSFNISNTYFMTDSRVVLAWIATRNLKLKQFVALRVGEILESSSRKEWFHVRSKMNVADDGTKWADSTMGDGSTRWFQGPAFLKTEPSEWPTEAASKIECNDEVVHFIGVHRHPGISFSILDQIQPKFKANWSKYVRIVAWLGKFLEAKIYKNQVKPYISPHDYARAELLIFRKIQVDAFPDEVSALINKENIERSSEIFKLTPIMDSDNVIRLSSRSQNATTSYAARNPPILPSKHEFVDLLIQEFHEEQFHIGEDATIANIRERAWIINLRSAFRRVKSRCQYCKIASARPEMPLMGQLPVARLDFSSKPFTHVGVDCFGHYDVKFGRGKIKRWVMIFTCLTFRAVHLELLNDMSTNECMAAIRRFQTRRGRNKAFYSDCGTNFVGANNQTKKDIKEMTAELTSKAAEKFKIDWHFQPAYSPWWGGAWERLIRSIKSCVDFVFVGDNPREDVLRNAITEAEYRMNGRPLTHLAIDHEDDKPLTPNLALFGDEDQELTNAPGIFTENDAFSRRAFRKSQHLADKMFSRWIKEYLPIITRRTKWFKDVKPIEVGDIAILIDPAQPRDAWKKGRITRVYPGQDDRVRAADIKLSDGTTKTNRSAGRLAVLDIKGSSIEQSKLKDGVEDVVEP